MSSRRFISPINSIPVEDPANKGRVARKIPKASLPLLSTDLTYVLVPHARRKDIALALAYERYLEVRTPKNYTLSDLREYEQYIVSKQEWIRYVLHAYQEREELSQDSLSSTFPDKDYILYLGKRYPFQITTSGPPHQISVTFHQDSFFEIQADANHQDELRLALSHWYLKRAEEILPPLVRKYASSMSLPVPDLTYRIIKSRWASCNPTKKQILFNALILKTPPDCIEYIVVHELCHFYVQNHQKEFWGMVSLILPDYHIQKKKLAAYRPLL